MVSPFRRQGRSCDLLVLKDPNTSHSWNRKPISLHTAHRTPAQSPEERDHYRYTHTRTHTRALTHTHAHALTHTHTNMLTRAHTYTYSLTRTRLLTLTHEHSLTHSLTITVTIPAPNRKSTTAPRAPHSRLPTAPSVYTWMG